MTITPRIAPCLWFDGEAEEAATFYVSVFPNSRIVSTTYYGETGSEVHGHDPGTVLQVAFELDGQPFTALNGGPQFRFSEAISFQICCDTQSEVDLYWDRLSQGGDAAAQVCGWLKDRFGVSWQVVPRVLPQLLMDPQPGRANRTMSALLRMKKLDIAALQAAADGR